MSFSDKWHVTAQKSGSISVYKHQTIYEYNETILLFPNYWLIKQS